MNTARFPRSIFMLALLLCMTVSLVAQTTGKISGTVKDAETEEPLPGANIVVEGSRYGAAADVDGRFYIINLPPGYYTVRIDMLGYTPIIMEDVLVSVNRTTPLEAKMSTTVLEGEVVVIEVERLAVKKDQTGTIKNVSSEQIEQLPIENLDAVVNMQAGVVEGHFRGGRATEVSYIIDGIQVDETYGGQYAAVDIEPEAIADLEVITGTFNAEYGRAMSGVVNAVTKDGGKEFEGSFAMGLGNYYTGHTDTVWIGLDPAEINRNQDYKFQLSGPVIGDRITFFFNTRFQDNKNHLNGIRRFNVDDYSNFYGTQAEWFSMATGDSSYVPMNASENRSILGKLTFKLPLGIRLSTMYSQNDDVWHSYSHAFKYNPDGMAADYRTTNFYVLNLNHMLSNTLFYEAKFSVMDNYGGYYVFENPTDSGYVNDLYLESYGPGFYTGGQVKDHGRRWTTDLGAKIDMSWQANPRHSFKSGAHYVDHQIEQIGHLIRNRYAGTPEEVYLYEPTVLPNNTVYTDSIVANPIDLAFYMQDKMEFDDMVINVGLRYDRFDPNTVYPSDRRNPNNQLDLPDSMMSTYPQAPATAQLSPRFGLAYQLGQAAVLHFSYGHFFQTPPFYALYTNNSFLVPPNDYGTIMGNALLKPEKTVTYEIGLWQELMPGLGLEVSLYYRDIYNLLSTVIVSTYNQIEYGLYSNKDYGNARGLEVKADWVEGPLSAYLNYTLQYTRGNADNPAQSFNRAGDSQDPVNRFIPMSWDQRHTLNATVGYNEDDYGVSLTAYYNSGTPYTFSPLQESTLSRVNLYPNNDYMPIRYSADLTSFYKMSLAGRYDLKFNLSIYNLFDRLNENAVNGTTGRAYTAVVREEDLLAHRSDFNEYDDRIHDPSMFAAPRYVKLGMSLGF